MDRIDIKSGTYVVAVSGGVDSVVLLDKLARQGHNKLIVAHFDHGIRPGSAKDREFVKQLAKKYGLPFEYAEGQLGPDASEAEARTLRYIFLEKIKKKYSADAIITAHHQDDLIETAIINLLRGTKRRGLSSLSSRPGLLRPLLKVPKFTIVKFGTQHHLRWHEDPTNQDTKYLRNYVRLVLIPQLDKADSTWRERFLQQLERGGELNRIIDTQLADLARRVISENAQGFSVSREAITNLPSEVGLELLRYQFGRLKPSIKIDRTKLKSAWLFIKTAKPGATVQLSGRVEMKLQDENVLVSTKTSH